MRTWKKIRTWTWTRTKCYKRLDKAENIRMIINDEDDVNAMYKGHKIFMRMTVRETVPSQTSDMGEKPLSVLAHKFLPP